MRSQTLKIKRRYRNGQWRQSWVHDAYEKGHITADEYAAIVSPGSIVAAIGSRPTKAQIMAAADALGADIPDNATNDEAMMLLRAEAGM